MATYDQHYADDPAACGPPFREVVAFAEAHARPGLRVLDLGCGQGRDALLFARRGCTVVGVDASEVGIVQLQAVAAREGLDLRAEVGDLRTYRPDGDFDVVILDRVLHMLTSDEERRAVLDLAKAATGPGGHLLVADGPKHRPLIRASVEGWIFLRDSKNRVFVRRP